MVQIHPNVMRKNSSNKQTLRTCGDAARALQRGGRSLDSLLVFLDKEFGTNPEGVDKWVQARLKALNEHFDRDPPELRKQLLNHYRSTWEPIVNQIAKHGFQRTVLESSDADRRRILREVLVILHHPEPLGTLVFRMHSPCRLPKVMRRSASDRQEEQE